MRRTGILLFAHGARDPSWARPFEAVAEKLRALAASSGSPATEVALAYLEFMAPDIGTAGDALVAQGCLDVAVVPLFLGAGGHVRKDLPRLLSELGLRHPGVSWRLCQAVGETDALIQAMAQVALSLAAPTPPQTCAG